MTRYPKSYLIARVFEVIIGIYFIAGAIPKGLDIEKFAVQIAAYKVIQSPNMLLATALLTLFIEIALGVAMIAGLRLKGLTILAMQGMLLFFTVLIVYAWRVHGLEDCGCFPVFKMTPQVSLIKNAIILAASIFILWALVWRGGVMRRRQGTEEEQRQSAPPKIGMPFLVGAKLALAVLLALAATAYAYRDVEWHTASAEQDSQGDISYAQFEIYMPEGYFNLGSGLYLVPIMSMSCSECMEKVPDINDLWYMPDIPTIIALCYEDNPGDMDVFKGYTQPLFPMYSMGSRIMLYYTLIDQEPFRLSLIHNGRLVTAWDGYVPPYEEIMEVVESISAL